MVNELDELTGPILEEAIEFTLTDLCQACSVRSETIIELVEEGVVEPIGSASEPWRVSGRNLRHARIAIRLQQDLNVNPAGAAVIVELLDEIQRLRNRRV